MADLTLTVRCACGWEANGPESDVVAATVEHGRRLHNMVPSREEVLAMAVAPDGAPPPEPGDQAPSGPVP
ncbi:MAG TPA: hypothetical protein VIH37_11490 [Candidatus Limnocylindrales bacterium]